ncbi:TonB-dependent receptor [Pseudoduganella ginsengisoli]
MAEVVITGAKPAGTHAQVGGFADLPLLLTPASVNVLDREKMQELNIRTTTDAAKFDASISDAYNAVGYAEQFSIRGFKLNNANSYRKDGLAISGDTQIPLENKEAIEVLKGLAGMQAGVAAPGGMVNYVTKRPTREALRSVTVEASERGTLLGHADLGGRFDDTRFGYRINVAAERLRSYIKGADGHRNFVSGAFDWQISPDVLLQVDGDYQKKAQVSAPGVQLINNATLPVIPADIMLNRQPWSKPVTTESSNIGMRLLAQLNNDWSATFSANRHAFKRDDYAAFPYGCGAENLYPGFCANGDFDVYDYQSLGERKTPQAAQALLQGKFATGAVSHALSAGWSWFKNSEEWGDYLYLGLDTPSNLYHPVVVPQKGGTSGPVSERRADREQAVFVQDVAGLTDKLKLHAGVRSAHVKRDEAGATPVDETFLLPNVALVYSPKANATAYASWAKGLEYGGVAPIGTSHPGHALAPSASKQVELGVKADIGDDISLAMAVFQIRTGLEFINAANDYVRGGERQHRGLEMRANGQLTRDVKLWFTAMALDTEQSGTGDPSMDGKRVTNVPKFRTSLWAEYALPQVDGLKLNANWQYASRKAFDNFNTVFVPGYSVLNLGASYAVKAGGVKTIIRAQVANATNKFYWRDVTPDLGGYLFPGAERTYKLSAQVDF